MASSIHINQVCERCPDLFASAQHCHKECILYYTNAGVDVNQKTFNSITALHNACMFDSTSECVKILCDKGADINIADSGEWTPLHYAVYGENYDTVVYLIEKGADAIAKDYMNRTPLSISITNGNNKITQFIENYSDPLEVKGGDWIMEDE